MRRPIQSLAHTLAVAALLCAAAAPAAESDGMTSAGVASDAEPTVQVDDAPTAEQMAADLIVMRPLSLAGTLIGTAVFIVALPFNALTLNFKDPARRLILEPAKYTFVRRLGDID